MNHAVQGFVSGQVRGVGFRNYVKQQAVTLGLSGHAMNLPDGRVDVFLAGPRCLLYTSPSPRDQRGSRMPSSA